MAIVTMIAGGLIGFLTGLVALILGFGPLPSFFLWFSVALGTSVLAGLFALLPRRHLSPVRA